MKTKSLFGLAALGGALCIAAAAHADTTHLKLVPSGAMPKIGFYRPQRLTLTATPPAGLKTAPKDLTAPLYGVLEIGPKGHAVTCIFVLDEPEGKDARLFVDSNGNGDLTDDPPAKWTRRTYPAQDGKQYSQYMGSAMIPLPDGKTTTPVSLGIYRFDKSDPARVALKNVLLYYRDYAYEGQIKLGDKTYRAMISDEMAKGDFRGAPGENSGVSLMIDVNGNGKFDSRGEVYDISKPFNIKGTTYEIAGMSASGSTFNVIKSAKNVAEILPPADLSIGQKALAFERKTTDGKTVIFPASYRGKVVMLDFWATWCGPCMGEVPNLARVYHKLHDRGFEILGISLDQKDSLDKVNSVTKDKNMTWAQVYDGKYWQADIAQLYAVDSIPRAYLVDGDTGAIIADSSTLRGEALEGTIEKALAKKSK